MLQTILEDCRVLPVVTAASVEATVQLARALQRGGMTAIEITLRSPAALDSIRAVTAQVPGMLVAAGTVTTAAELEQAVAALPRAQQRRREARELRDGLGLVDPPEFVAHSVSTSSPSCLRS